MYGLGSGDLRRAPSGGSGVFIAVAGPSGAGKDSLIRAAQQHFGSNRDVVFVRRVITRPPDLHEDHETATPVQFRDAAERGEFALLWEANGLSYGIPRSVDDALCSCAVVVANVSRDVLPQVRERFARTLIVHVTASLETLRHRLAARGREDDAAQDARLARSLLREASVEADVRIENNGDLDKALQQFVNAINRVIAPLRRTGDHRA